MNSTPSASSIARIHQEINALNWLNAVGTLLKNNLVDENAWMDLFSRLVVAYWERLEPVIAIMRRKRGDWQYANFEYMAMRARMWLKKHPQGTFPSRTPRATVTDRWLAEDQSLQSGKPNPDCLRRLPSAAAPHRYGHVPLYRHRGLDRALGALSRRDEGRCAQSRRDRTLRRSPRTTATCSRPWATHFALPFTMSPTR